MELPTLVFPQGGVDPSLVQDSDFRPNKAFHALQDLQIRSLEQQVLLLQQQLAVATPLSAVAPNAHVYTVADNGVTLPSTSQLVAVDTTGGPVQLYVPSFAATPRILSFADMGPLNVPGSQGFAAHPLTFRALGPVIWDPLQQALVNQLTFSAKGQQGSLVAILNHPIYGSFWMQSADALATTNVLFGAVVSSSSLVTSVQLPTQSGLLCADTTGGPLTAYLPNLGAYAPYVVSIVDVSLGNNSMQRNPLTVRTTGGLQLLAPWSPPNQAYAPLTLQSYLVLGGVNDWLPARTTTLMLQPTTPPKFLVTG